MQFVNLHPSVHLLTCPSYCDKIYTKTVAWGFARESVGAPNNIYLKNKNVLAVGSPGVWSSLRGDG